VEVLGRLFARNWTLKLVALGLAVMLWVVVRVEAPVSESIVGVPVEVVVTDANWMLVGQPDPQTVEVAFEGTTRDLMRLNAQNVRVRVLLDSVTTSDTALGLVREQVVLPEGSDAVAEDVIPGLVELRLDRVQTRSVAFVVPTVGTLDTTLALLADPEPSPAQARIRGPAGRLEAVRSVPLEVLDLSQIEGSGAVRLAVDTSALPGLEVTPHQVDVTLNVEPLAIRTLVNIPVIVDEGWLAEPGSVTITLRGAESLVAAVDPTQIRPVVRAASGEEISADQDYTINVTGLPPLVVAQTDQRTARLRLAPVGPTR